MPGKSLDVPYYVQPTPITCQSTCLKMFGKYLEHKRAMSSAGPNKSIQEIWREINVGNDRPVKARNAYANMKWWLEKHFSPQAFQITQTTDSHIAGCTAKAKIDAGYPLLVSTNHDRTAGHIILIVGYGQDAAQTSGSTYFVCHDPYGKFDPQLQSKQYGKRRHEGGMSVLVGGESGPGKSVAYDIQGIRRVRNDRHSAGKFFMISARI